MEEPARVSLPTQGPSLSRRKNLKFKGAFNLSVSPSDLARIAGIVASLFFVLASIGAILLSLGLWTRQEAFTGPFRQEADSRLLVVPIGQSLPLPWLLDSGSDYNGNPERSDLRLFVNGEEWGSAHTPYALLRSSQANAYSHWERRLYFVPLPDTANDASLRATVVYSPVCARQRSSC